PLAERHRGAGVTTGSEEDLRTISPAAARRLAEMLAGAHAELLPQWLEMAAERGLVVPSDLLPALQAHAGGDARAAEALRRGIAADDLDSAFAAGTPLARAAAFVRLRRRDPATALARLAAGWPGESGEDREALIGRLAVGLGPADEAFLEAAAGDFSKEVRER